MLQPAPFPASRPRRLRQAPWIRSMVAENVLTPADFIWPCFVIEGQDKAEPVPSMPGVERMSIDRLVQEARDRIVVHIIPGRGMAPTAPDVIRTEVRSILGDVNSAIG